MAGAEFGDAYLHFRGHILSVPPPDRRMYSELISAAIGSGGPHAARTSQVKLMRSVKKVALRLIETFVDKAEDVNAVAQQFVPAMMDPILGDYARNVPDARCGGPVAQLHTLTLCLLSSLGRGKFAACACPEASIVIGPSPCACLEGPRVHLSRLRMQERCVHVRCCAVAPL